MKIALFVTCLSDALFPEVGKAVVTLLERLGHDVAFPAAQTCCGQMHVNTGYRREALGLVRHHVETFEPYDVIVAPSGSCVGSVRHQHADVARAARCDGDIDGIDAPPAVRQTRDDGIRERRRRTRTGPRHQSAMARWLVERRFKSDEIIARIGKIDPVSAKANCRAGKIVVGELKRARGIDDEPRGESPQSLKARGIIALERKRNNGS